MSKPKPLATALKFHKAAAQMAKHVTSASKTAHTSVVTPTALSQLTHLFVTNKTHVQKVLSVS